MTFVGRDEPRLTLACLARLGASQAGIGAQIAALTCRRRDRSLEWLVLVGADVWQARLLTAGRRAQLGKQVKLLTGALVHLEPISVGCTGQIVVAS